MGEIKLTFTRMEKKKKKQPTKPILTLFCDFMSAETEMSAESLSNVPEVVKLISGKGRIMCSDLLTVSLCISLLPLSSSVCLLLR